MERQTKKQVPYKQICLLPFLLDAIKHNNTGVVEQILEVNENYFHKEENQPFDHRLDAWFRENNSNAKEETVYVKEAIRQKNVKILKLLIKYGFKTTFFKEGKAKDENEEGVSPFDPFAITFSTQINTDHPFITEDEEILTVLLMGVDDINAEYNVSWCDSKGGLCHGSMTLLSIALEYNQVRVADALVKNGASIEFNFVQVLMKQDIYSFGWGMSTHLNSAAHQGFVEEDNQREDFMIRKLIEAPISMILKKGTSRQINWLKLKLCTNPRIGIEIKLIALYLDHNQYRRFAENFPDIAKGITLDEILRSSNYEALRYYINRTRGRISAEDLLRLLDFRTQSKRPWNEIISNLLTADIIGCLMQITKRQSNLWKSYALKNQIFNHILFLHWFIGQEHADFIKSLCQKESWQKFDESIRAEDIRANAEGLLLFYQSIAEETADATDFIEWYYNIGRGFLKRTDCISYSIQMLRLCYQINDSKKVGLNVSKIKCNESSISQTEINEILNLFDIYYDKDMLSLFHRTIIDRGNTRLLKKLLHSCDHSMDTIKDMADYAIRSHCENMIPYLLLYKMGLEEKDEIV